MTREDVVVVLGEQAPEELGELDLSAPFPGDSLAFVEFVMDVEDALGVELDEQQVARTQVVGDLVELCVAAAGPSAAS